MAGSGGHLFITRADLKSIACDAWLLPTDAALRIEPVWHERVPAPERAALVDGGNLPRDRVRSLGDGVSRFAQGEEDAPPVTLLAEIGTARPSAGWFGERARTFVGVASSRADLYAAGGRERPLVAVPMIGTGAGGGGDIAGEVVRSVVGGFAAALREAAIDVVICARTEEAFAAAQHARDLEVPDAFNDFDEHQAEAARGISELARGGSLVVFAGAGLGVGAGLPLWGDLLERLAKKVSVSTDDSFNRLPVVDRARLLELRLGGKRKLGEEVVEILSAERPSLAQYLVASLPVDQAATTNYDQLLEAAACSIGRPFSALPYNPPGDRWLLKMHGCVSKPGEIVLTRDDYLRFAEVRGALSGVVQALLITKDMLFVGFSLEDDNFHRLVHQVRTTVGERSERPGRRRLGTALMRGVDDNFTELWGDEIDFVSFGGSGRQVERFLDFLLSRTVVDQAAYLLDHRFDSLWCADESKRALRGALHDAEATLRAAGALEDPFAQPFADLLKRYGSRP